MTQQPPELPRLSKRMGELGLCSRREADRWITNGWVKVDGKVVNTLGVRVSLQARIEIEAAARQYVRKISGVQKTSAATEEAFETAVAVLTAASHEVLEALPPRKNPPPTLPPLRRLAAAKAG